MYCTDDVDECTAGTAGCDVNADCTNTVNGFTCGCRIGYTGNGKICTGILLYFYQPYMYFIPP